MPGELDTVGEGEEGGEFDPADLFDEPGGVVVEESAGEGGGGPGAGWGGRSSGECLLPGQGNYRMYGWRGCGSP